MYASDRSTQKYMIRPILLAACATLALLAGSAQAADKEQEQVKRLRLQMRQLQQEQSSLQEAQAKADQEKQQAEKALKSASAELQGQRQAVTANVRRANALAQEVAALKEEKIRLEQQTQALTQQLEQANQTAQASKAQFLQTEGELKGKNQALAVRIDQCAAQNVQLHQLGSELLQRYEDKGLRQVLATQDPFLQLARVQLENVKAEYQDKLDAARLKAAAASAK